MGRLFVALIAIVLAGACTQNGSSRAAEPAASTPATDTAAKPPCQPIETRQANAASQQPTFAGQTRACEAVSNVAFDVQVVTRGLSEPWAVEPLPSGELLVTEKPGRMRIVSATGNLGPPIAGVPAVDDRGQGGLLDVALSPNFATDRTIYWSYSEPRQGGNGTSVARAVLSATDGGSKTFA